MRSGTACLGSSYLLHYLRYSKKSGNYEQAWMICEGSGVHVLDFLVEVGLSYVVGGKPFFTCEKENRYSSL